MVKVCNKCGQSKTENSDNFEWRSDTQKYRGLCRICVQKRRAKYREENRDKIRKADKEHYKNNADKIKRRTKKYASNNIEKVRETKRKYRKKNADKIKKRDQKYREENKEKIQQTIKRWRKENKEQLRIKKAKYLRNRRKTDIQFRLKESVSNMMRIYLYRRNASKGGKSIKHILPYTIDELKTHLESQFESWMSWDNWGIYKPSAWDDNDSSTWTWNIDHRIPQSKFKYSSINDHEFLECWALDNLRPLKSKDNIINGAKISHG